MYYRKGIFNKFFCMCAFWASLLCGGYDCLAAEEDKPVDRRPKIPKDFKYVSEWDSVGKATDHDERDRKISFESVKRRVRFDSLIQGKRGKYARLNGKMFKRGDSVCIQIEGKNYCLTVSKITNSSVFLEYNDKHHEVTFEPAGHSLSKQGAGNRKPFKQSDYPENMKPEKGNVFRAADLANQAAYERYGARPFASSSFVRVDNNGSPYFNAVASYKLDSMGAKVIFSEDGSTKVTVWLIPKALRRMNIRK